MDRSDQSARAASPQTRRILIVLVATLAYPLMFAGLYPAIGPGTAALTALPVAIAGWLLGWQVGIFAALLLLLINTLLLNCAGQPGWMVVFHTGGAPGTVVSLVIGGAAGWLRQLLDRLRQQAADLERERAALRKLVQESIQTQTALRESEERFRSLIDDLHVGVALQGPHAEILLANRAALDIFGATNDQAIGRTSYNSGLTVIHQDGSPFPAEMQPVPLAIATGQPVRGVVMGIFRAPRHDWVWLQVDAQPQFAADGSVRQVICTFSDITKREQAELALRRHDAILESISFAAACFLETSSWELAIPAVLERIGAAAAVSRVYLFANRQPGQDPMSPSQRYEWAAAGVVPLIKKQELQHATYQTAGFARWEELLSRGELVVGHVRALPERERELLLSYSIDSILVVPIFAGQRWWGFIGFDQCDGERQWSPSEIDVLRLAAGLIGAAIERERAEATLRENEQRYRDLFASARRQAQDLALLNQIRTVLARELDLQTIFRNVVEAIASTFGYTQVSLYLVEGDLLRLQHQVGYDQVIAQISITQGVAGRVVRSGQPVLLRDATSDPTFIGAIAGIVSEICVPLLDQEQIIGILNVESVDGVTLHEGDLRLLLSISEHVNIAIERARLYTSVRETERKMLETQKLESLGVLAGGIAHDFNNLLMAILGNADMAMLDLTPQDPAHESIAQIQIAAKRAAELTSQMLAYAGKGQFVVERFDLNLLVEEITALLMVSIAKTTMLRYNLDLNLPLIEGDPAQIRQVVMNLVINAAEALGGREGLITISTGVRYVEHDYFLTTRLAPDLPTGNYVYLEVNDTGSGMDEATLVKIFDPFFTTKFTGRGLGLAAVSGIVRSHNGAMHVQSKPGHGTIFTILLPAVDWPDAEINPAPEALPAQPAPAQAANRATLLVVDDESGVRAITAGLLERAGYHVLTSVDGRDAIELFDTHAKQISIVLLDLMMPQLNGEETLRSMRAIRPGLPAVIMSGYDEQELTNRFAGLGLVSFLQKPFSAQALYHCVEHALVGAQPEA